MLFDMLASKYTYFNQLNHPLMSKSLTPFFISFYVRQLIDLLKLLWQAWLLIPTLHFFYSTPHIPGTTLLISTCQTFSLPIEMLEIYKLTQVLFRSKLLKNTFPHCRSTNLRTILSEGQFLPMDNLLLVYKLTACLQEENGFTKMAATSHSSWQ